MTAETPDATRRAMLLAGGGVMGRRIADHDWSGSLLGPIGKWPEALLNAVSLMLPAAAEIVLFWGADYVAIYNDAYAPTIGDKHPHALGRPARESWNELWDDLEPMLAQVRATGETHAAKDRPFYIERSGDGEEVYFDISFSAVRATDGSVGGVLCIVSETTERVRASRVIAADRERLSQMFDQAPSFMAVLRSPGHVFELVNASFLQLVGHRDLVGRPLWDAMPGIAAQGFAELLDTVVQTGQPFRGDGIPITIQRDPDGPLEERLVDFIYQPITDVDGRVTGVFVEGVDVTERHAAEAALEVSRRSLDLATDAAEIGIWDLDLVTDTLVWSDRTKAMFGISPGVPCSMDDFRAGLHPDDLEGTLDAFAAALDPDRRQLYDMVYRTIGAEDRVIRWIAARGRGIFDDSGRCLRAIGTAIDITRSRALAEELHESEERFRMLADTAPALIWLTDPQGEAAFVNRAFETLLGVDPEDVAREGWKRVIHPDDVALALAARRERAATPAPFSGDVRVLDRDGATRWIHVEIQPRFAGGIFVGSVGCGVDVTQAHLASEALEMRIAERTDELAASNRLLTEQVTEREAVEATLHQMQRLEALGQLTSGVAHDFNNLLTVVLGNVEMIERIGAAADLDPRVLRRLDHVRTAAQRGAALTAQLLAFARRSRLEAKVVDLNETVSGMRDLLDSAIGGSVEIRTELDDHLWPALVDPTQIELIILNLAINARDAMEVGGRLTISTRNVSLGAPTRPEEPAPGDYVLVQVADTGTGMSDAVLAKAFEPFFTTKAVGKGSGLGLAQAFGFAKQSGGGVRIETTLGEGTCVCVYLPRTDPVDVPETAAAIELRTDASPHPEHTVLVLDDDDAVRAVTADGLRDAGYRVVEAADGFAALDALDAVPAIGLVVADFAMPGMNGAEFARRARAMHPGLPIVFVTGFADLDALTDVGPDAILQKPFRASDLSARVRNAF